MKESNTELREKLNQRLGDHYAWITEKLGNPTTSYTEVDHEKNRFIDEILDLLHQHTAHIAEEVEKLKYKVHPTLIWEKEIEPGHFSSNPNGGVFNEAIDAAVTVIKKKI